MDLSNCAIIKKTDGLWTLCGIFRHWSQARAAFSTMKMHRLIAELERQLVTAATGICGMWHRLRQVKSRPDTSCTSSNGICVRGAIRVQTVSKFQLIMTCFSQVLFDTKLDWLFTYTISYMSRHAFSCDFPLGNFSFAAFSREMWRKKSTLINVI